MLVLLTASQVEAQSYSFQLAPQLHEIVSQRGKKVVLPYTLTNIGDPQVIRLSIYTLQIKDNEGNYDIDPYLAKENNISFQIVGGSVALDEPILIKNNEKLDFDIEMDIPPSINERDYAFSLIAETETQHGFSNANEILLQGGIGSNILLTVTDSGLIDSKGQIIQYDILSPKSITYKGKKIFFFNSNEAVPVLLIAANKGKNYTKASGSLTLIPQYSDKKSERPSYTIQPQYMFSGSQRILHTSKDPACDNNKTDICNKTHSIVFNAPVLGIFRLAAVVSFGENSQIGYDNITFVSFPFIPAIIALAGFIIITVSILRLRKHLAKK